MRPFLSSWSARVGLALLLPLFLFVPWRQELLWRTGDDIVVPLRIIRYGFVWDRPLEASIDVRRLIAEIILLVVAVIIAYQFERSRLSTSSMAPR